MWIPLTIGHRKTLGQNAAPNRSAMIHKQLRARLYFRDSLAPEIFYETGHHRAIGARQNFAFDNSPNDWQTG
ncbi:hypothetical protein [Comamonas sp. 4034]|uniref:hypothetical protein n=1 Tax=Comamonas sp. 4034 TaxID=3156455 RepID=UPI003D1E1DEE